MGFFFEKRSNNALNVNPNIFTYPNTSDINITTRGSDVYWAVCALMSFSTIVFIGLSFTVDRTKRIFHYITAAITMIAAISYFTMASNLGYAAIVVEFQRSNPVVSGPPNATREIFYVRYIDWFVTTPVCTCHTIFFCAISHLQLLLLDILLTAGLPWPTILYTILIDEVMVVTGLVGALVTSSYKWGYFVFAMFALFFIAYNLLWVGRIHAHHISPVVGRTYVLCGAWTIFLWFLYPIAWGLSEGANVIAPDSEAVFYGILDALAKPVFGALLLWGHRNIDPAILGLHIRDYDDVPSKNHINRKEKNPPVNHNIPGGPGEQDNNTLADTYAFATTTGSPNAPINTGERNV
jgi:bacteriorhodopsin